MVNHTWAHPHQQTASLDRHLSRAGQETASDRQVVLAAYSASCFTDHQSRSALAGGAHSVECALPAGQAESLRLTRELGLAGVRPWLVIASTVSRSRSRSCRSTRPGRPSTPWHVSTTSRAP